MTEEMLERAEWNHTAWGNAWYEGFFAGQKGLSKFINPYEGTEYEDTWLHGWKVGNEDA